jgi:hypothetical protein
MFLDCIIIDSPWGKLAVNRQNGNTEIPSGAFADGRFRKEASQILHAARTMLFRRRRFRPNQIRGPDPRNPKPTFSYEAWNPHAANSQRLLE